MSTAAGGVGGGAAGGVGGGAAGGVGGGAASGVGGGAAPRPPRDLARATVAMSVLTVASRVTGLVRVLVVAAVLGTTYLGNLYQSTNTVPNLLFELLAAGALQAVLVPTLVAALDGGRRDEAERVAGAVLGLVGLGLAVLSVGAAVAAPWIVRGLVAGVEDPVVRADQVRLGTVLLWWFLPQVVCYAAGVVATGVLHAQERFAAPAAAPIVNNVVVVAGYLVFWRLRDGAPPSLDLSVAEVVALAGGTTLAVVAFTAVPVVALRRTGFRLRPRLDARHPLVRRLGRQGGWAILQLAASQVLLLAVLVLANRVAGGVVAYQVGMTFFLLPHAVLAVPVITAAFPRLARRAQASDVAGYADGVAASLRVLAYLALPSSAVLLALAGPLTRALVFGQAGGSGADQVAGAVAGFAPGLLGFGASLLLTRAAYAVGDARTPALVAAGTAIAGVVAMALAGAVVDDDDLVLALAATHSAVHLTGAVLLGLRLRRHLGGAAPVAAGPLLRGVAVAAAAGLAAWGVAGALQPGGRLGAVAQVAVAGVVGLGVHVGGSAVTGTRPGDVVAALRGGGDRT